MNRHGVCGCMAIPMLVTVRGWAPSGVTARSHRPSWPRALSLAVATAETAVEAAMATQAAPTAAARVTVAPSADEARPAAAGLAAGRQVAVEAVTALREARGALAGQPVQKDHRRASQPPSLNHLR